ncbi:MAG: hypothetical protein RPR40_06210 [Bermanella sp.]
MKKLSLIGFVLASFTMQAHASLGNICQPLQKAAKVQYSIETRQPTGQQSRQDFTLWRTSQKVAHQYPLKSLSQQWTRSHDGRLTQTQYFEQDLRAIEFETQSPQDSSQAHWQKKFQLISSQLIKAMDLVTSKGRACDLLEYYQLEKDGVLHQLSWLPNKNLVSRYRISSAKMSKEWLLQSVNYDADLVADFFNARDHYQATDFADIGDHESDPVLSKLIHLGFSR